jgi:hypothetical protein
MIQLALLFAMNITPDMPNVAYRQPQVAVDGKRAAIAFGAGNDIFCSISLDGGVTFSKPMKVGSAGVMSLGRHRGPRVAYSGNAIVITAVAGAQGMGKDGDIITFRSLDGGKTWAKGARVNDVVSSAREGLHTMISGQGGILFAAWLDLRGKGTRLFGATSRDMGVTWSKNMLVYESPDGHICECCHPTAMVSADGRFHVMFRNWLDGSRDMYDAISTPDHARFEAAKLGEGTWKLNACPMDGGSLFTGGSVWRRDGAIYFATTGKPEVELGKGKDASATMVKDELFAAWSEGTAIRTNGGKTLTEDGAFVNIAGTDIVIAAWEAKGSIGIAKLR